MEDIQRSRGWIYRNRKLVAGVVIVFLSLLVTIAGLSISLNNAANSDIDVPRLDIDVPRSVIPDSCVYPATYDIDYTTSYLIRGDYAPLINVSEETAVDAALVFVREYLPEELLTGLRLIDSGEEYWRGLPTLSTDNWPRWTMTLVSNHIEAVVDVNALSGKVVKFWLTSYDTTVFAFERIDSIAEAENHTINFLQSQNYTLLPNAVYDGVSLYSTQVNPYYRLTFHQKIDEISIGFGEIYFEIDATYGLIERFSYKWIDLDEIPAESILTVEEINNIVIDNASATFWKKITDFELRLEIINFDPNSSNFVMRLVYNLYLKPIWGVGGDSYTIDAISGEIVSIYPLF